VCCVGVGVGHYCVTWIVRCVVVVRSGGGELVCGAERDIQCQQPTIVRRRWNSSVVRTTAVDCVRIDCPRVVVGVY